MMAGNPVQLAADSADIPGTFRHLYACQLFHRHAEAQVVVHGGHIIQPVRKGHALLIGPGLHQLLNTTVQIAHHRLCPHYILTIQLHLHLQDAMGTRMLWSHIQDELFCLCHVSTPPSIFGCKGTKSLRRGCAV